MDRRSFKKAIIITAALGIAGVLAFFAGTLIAKHKLEADQLRRAAPEHFITYSGFPENATVEATIARKGKTTQLVVDNGEVFLPQQIADDFSVPYITKMVVRTPEDKYYDFEWSINKLGLDYNIGVAGFSPDDKASLIFEKEVVQTVPLDWSGRIQFSMIKTNDHKHSTCVEIQQEKQKYRLCHTLTAKAGA